eukprot:6274798-Ditylum_brightwellii.AAC.1
MFKPSEKNVLRIQNPSEIEIGETHENLYWQGFAGQWGKSTELNSTPKLEFCMSKDQTKIIDCPDDKKDPTFSLVMQLMGVNKTNDEIVRGAASIVGAALIPIFSKASSSPTGPIMKEHWNKWRESKSSPLWRTLYNNTTSNEYCKVLSIVTDTGRLPVKREDVDVNGNIIGMIVLCVGIVILNIFTLQCRVKLKGVLLDIDDDTGEVLQPGRQL